MPAAKGYDPFRAVKGLRPVEFVDSAAGSQKTRQAIEISVKRARAGEKIIFCQPTHQLIRESLEYADEVDRGLRGRDGWHLPLVEITGRERSDKDYGETTYNVTGRIIRHITGRNEKGGEVKDVPKGGHLLFITHAAFLRLPYWPPEAEDFELIIDEVFDVILTREPFKLRDNHFLLTSFTEVESALASPRARAIYQKQFAEQRAKRDRWAKKHHVEPFTLKDLARAEKLRAIIDPKANASQGERDNAEKALQRLMDKKAKWDQAQKGGHQQGEEAPQVEPPQPTMAPEEDEDSYTSRLLRAKRDVWKK